MMIVWNALLLAFRQIARNKLRSFLTTLGITIGVASVIAMVSLGQSATASVNRDLQSLGQNLLFVVPGEARPGMRQASTRPFSMADAIAIRNEVPGIEAVAPVSSSSGTMVYGNVSHRAQVYGVNNEYLTARQWSVSRGETFTAGELLAGSPVALLGNTVREELFGGLDPIGQTIRVNGIAVRVIGILETRGNSTMGQDQDDLAMIPLRTFQRRIAGNSDVNLIFVSAASDDLIDSVKAGIEDVLNVRRHTRAGIDPDFSVRDMREMAATVGSVTTVLTLLLAAIAGVSLVVGGIGIMNIMLVSVTERTREIGIRLSIGARSRDVMLQFLIEAIVLSVLGGAAGIAMGLGGCYAATRQFALPFVVDPSVVLLAVASSAIIGVAFGFFPARKASLLNPIDALRHE